MRINRVKETEKVDCVVENNRYIMLENAPVSGTGQKGLNETGTEYYFITSIQDRTNRVKETGTVDYVAVNKRYILPENAPINRTDKKG
jgi:hypothetical protein